MRPAVADWASNSHLLALDLEACCGTEDKPGLGRMRDEEGERGSDGETAPLAKC